MISTQEEAELVLGKWMEDLSTIFFTALRPDRTIIQSFYGNVVGISGNLVLITGAEDRAEIDIGDAQFAFLTGRDVPREVQLDPDSQFETGMVICKATGSMYAFFEIIQK